MAQERTEYTSPTMAIGIAIELMLIPIAWAVRFVEEHTDKDEK